MSERRLRLLLAGLAFVTLCLPWDRPPVSRHNWWLWLEALSYLHIPYLLYGLGVPVVCLANVWLSLAPSTSLKIIYGVFSLPIMLFATWHFTLYPYVEARWRGIGFWANWVVVSIAVLFEIALLIIGRLRNTGQAGRKTN